VEDKGKWVAVGSAASIAPGGMEGVEFEGRKIALYNLHGVYYATDNMCTHAFALLTEGWIEGESIECPLHGGKFDIITGKALEEPAECALTTYRVRVADDKIEIFLSDDAT
jgi:nitrite reductase/ring-hydroxylating ferredoxin subunit